jgi:hypothetical protein
MKKDSIFLIIKRIFTAIIDIGIVFMASMMLMIFIAEPVAEVTINISEVRKEYEQKCLEYEIHYYDEVTKQYKENENITEEQKNAFENDERVKELTKIQNNTVAIELYGSISLASIVFYIIIPLTNNRGSTLGKKFMNLAVVDSKKEYVSKKVLVIRGASYFLINIIGGIISNGLFIVASLLVCIINKDGKSIHDLIAKTNIIALNSKYDIVSEEDDEYYKRIAKENARDLTVKGDNYYDK